MQQRRAHPDSRRTSEGLFAPTRGSIIEAEIFKLVNGRPADRRWRGRNRLGAERRIESKGFSDARGVKSKFARIIEATDGDSLGQEKLAEKNERRLPSRICNYSAIKKRLFCIDQRLLEAGSANRAACHQETYARVIF